MADPNPRSPEIQKAIDEHKLIISDVRSATKLLPDSPKIAICIPMGDKDDPDMFVCEGCGHRHFGRVICPKCKAESDARYKLRAAGLAPIEWLMNAWQIVPPLLVSMVILSRKSILSAQARQEMTEEAIRMGCKYIFYWDDDTLIPPKAIYDMHNMMERHPEAAVITGVYTTREKCQEPLVYKHQGQGAYWEFPTTTGVLDPIFAAGAGCMMARVEALQEVNAIIPGPWWLDEHDDMTLSSSTSNRVMWGHDIRFCRRIHEARESGATSKPWQVYLAGWIQCFHFDIRNQILYGLPQDAPCFHDQNRASYWDHVWSSEGQDTPRTYPALFDRICSLVPEDSNVVDFGCGIGVLMDMLTKKKHVRAYGYDISPKAIEMLQSRWLEGEVMDAKDFSLNHFKPNKTVFVATETLEHLDEERFARVTQEMKKAKVAIVTTPDGKMERMPDGEHLRVFTADSLRAEMKKHFPKAKVEKIGAHLLAVGSRGK
jgi:hypothetical protein